MPTWPLIVVGVWLLALLWAVSLLSVAARADEDTERAVEMLAYSEREKHLEHELRLERQRRLLQEERFEQQQRRQQEQHSGKKGTGRFDRSQPETPAATAESSSERTET